MGTVVLVGGALQADNEAVFERILEHAGPRVAIFGTASPDPAASLRKLGAAFARYGAEPELVDITVENAAQRAHDPEVLARLERCGGFFFGGGDQRKITRALLGTPALEVLRRRFAEGACVGGTSAGTAAMADPMICGGTSLDSLLGHGDVVCFEEGLGFVGFQVDQHFLAWGRLGRLLKALEHTACPLGVGIDENTALVVPEGGPWEVVGASHVTFLERDSSGVHVSLLAHGDGYDPATGNFLIHPHREPIAEPLDDPCDLYSTDIFGPRALPPFLARLADNPAPSATGIAFRGSLEPRFSALGVKLGFHKTRQTAGYCGSPAFGERYSVVRVRTEVAPIRASIENL
ncbi:cyanophycinase [Calidithermus chliarophilus]|uniref:cyanophycinase n=1 Tax=Calidithermus chliarophilus TaxID=52023 RepID=UPI00041575DD|nr:cyanophycinase [Calidithermus chliarophilus]